MAERNCLDFLFCLSSKVSVLGTWRLLIFDYFKQIMICKSQKLQNSKVDVCSKNADLQFFVCCLIFGQSSFFVARIECILLIISKYVSLLFWNEWLFLRILKWTSYPEIFWNFLFWFYNSDLSKIWELFVFEECKAAWLMRNNVSCATFAVITAAFTNIQDFLFRCHEIVK